MELERLYPYNDNDKTDIVISLIFSSLKLQKLSIDNDLFINKALNLIREWSDEDNLLEDVLIEMVNSNQLEIVKFVVELGADINNTEALEYSAANGDLEIVKYLVNKGADIHYNDEMALRRSAENGRLEVVKYLVYKGADIHADAEGALKKSAINGHLEVVKYLVSQGADIHVDNEWVLKWSIYTQKWPVIYYLLSLGADYKKVFSSISSYSKIRICRYIFPIKKIQRWILAIQAKPYYKDGSIGFLAQSAIKASNLSCPI